IAHHQAEIVAHQVKHRAQQIVSAMFLGKLLLAGVDRRFGRRHGKDQPALTHLNEAQAENVAKEGPVGFRILAVEKKMSASKHVPEYIRSPHRSLTNFARFLRMKSDVTLRLARCFRAANGWLHAGRVSFANSRITGKWRCSSGG